MEGKMVTKPKEKPPQLSSGSAAGQRLKPERFITRQLKLR